MTIMELPLAEPPVRGYMMYSYHLSATLAHVKAWPWIHSNYVQLQCDPSQLALDSFLKFTNMPKGEVHFTEGTSRFNPWVADCPQVTQAEILASDSSPAHYVVNALERGHYVETFVDEFHIGALFNGGVRHFRHRLLVHGHDAAAGRLLIVGFDSRKLYRKLQCTFEEFDRAFSEVEPQPFETTKLFKPVEDVEHPPDFDLARFLMLAHDYLAADASRQDTDLHGSGAPSGELWFGIRIYEFLAKYILAAVEKKIVRPDIRGFHLLWEHKKIMLDRMKWMQSAGFRVDDETVVQYRRVMTLCEMARNRVVLFSRGLHEVDSGHGYLTEVAQYMEDACAQETSALQALIHALQR